MARRKINVSAAIKEFLGEHSGVGPTEAAKAISEKIGKKVSPIYVSNIKTLMSKGKGKKKRGRKPGKKSAHSSNGSNGSIDLATLEAMKEILGKVGAETARTMIDVLS
jgi:hypothetical protein